MVAKGNKDGHRYSYSEGVRAVEKSKWGHTAARVRYGAPKFEHGAPRPKDASFPQFKEDQPADRSYNDTSGWVRAEGEDATSKPGFDSVGKKGYHGRR
jgi:hypothetical protein